MELHQFKPGDAVRFVYDSGSNPGSTRSLKIESVNPSRKTATGVDLDKNEVRTFSSSYASNIRMLEIKKVSFIEARRQAVSDINRLTGEQLAQLYSVGREDVDGKAMFDASTGEIITVSEKPLEESVSAQINISQGMILLNFENKYGEIMEVKIYDSSPNTVRIDSADYSVEALGAELDAFFNN